MQMIKDEIRYTKAELAGGTGLGMVVLLGAVALLCFSGCAGAGFRTEIYRIDQRQESVSTINQPIKCLFTECGGK